MKPLHAGLMIGLLSSLGALPALADEPVKTGEPAASDATLPALVIKGEGEAETILGPVIEKDSSAATKTDTPIVDTARSVSVETRQQIEDKGFLRLEDAFGYTAGVHGGTYGFDSRGDWGDIRGFDMPMSYLDGLQTGNDGYYNTSLPDMDMLDRVEIIKGPASALYGASSVGGIVNAVSKRPEETTLRRATIEYGTFDRMQAMVDMTGKLDDSGKILGRVVALVRDSKTQVDYSRNDALLFSPSITLRPDAKTDITFLARYQKTNFTPDIQFLPQAGTLDPSPASHGGAKLPTSTFIGEPGYDRLDSTDEAITIDARHRFDDVWSVQGIFRASHSDSTYNQAYWDGNSGTDGYDPAGNIDRVFYSQYGSTYMMLGDLNTKAEFNTGVVAHEMLFGANYSHVKFDNDYNQCVAGDPCYTVGTIDPFNPVYTGVPVFPVLDMPSITYKQTGFYVQDQATILERIILTGGLRWDKFEAQDQYSPTQVDEHDVTANASLLYKFDAGFSPYVSYAESFLQESYGTTFNGDLFQPTHGKQYEIGLKYQPPGTSSLFTVAAFDITKSNMLVDDPAHPTFSLQSGEAKSKGIELEAQTIVDTFYIEGNYSYIRTKSELGSQFDTVPKHLASGWVTWRPEGNIQGFKMGGGVRFVGANYYGGTRTPSYTLGDAMIGYETDDWDLTLNGRNITDRVYVTTAGYGSGYWGQRRTVVLSLSRNF